jgi:hypothetical protein
MLQYQIAVTDRSCISDQAPPRDSLFAALEDVYERVDEKRAFEVIEVIERDTDTEAERVVFSVYPCAWGVLCYSPILTLIGDIEEAGAVK